jgi:hypothetical protein
MSDNTIWQDMTSFQRKFWKKDDEVWKRHKAGEVTEKEYLAEMRRFLDGMDKTDVEPYIIERFERILRD